MKEFSFEDKTETNQELSQKIVWL